MQTRNSWLLFNTSLIVLATLMNLMSNLGDPGIIVSGPSSSQLSFFEKPNSESWNSSILQRRRLDGIRFTFMSNFMWVRAGIASEEIYVHVVHSSQLLRMERWVTEEKKARLKYGFRGYMWYSCRSTDILWGATTFGSCPKMDLLNLELGDCRIQTEGLGVAQYEKLTIPWQTESISTTSWLPTSEQMTSDLTCWAKNEGGFVVEFRIVHRKARPEFSWRRFTSA